MTEGVNYVPYQAYKSKRHSRNFSSPTQAQGHSPNSTSRPPSFIEDLPPPLTASNGEKSVVVTVIQHEPAFQLNGKKEISAGIMKPSAGNGIVQREAGELAVNGGVPPEEQNLRSTSPNPSLAREDATSPKFSNAPEIAVTAPPDSASDVQPAVVGDTPQEPIQNYTAIPASNIPSSSVPVSASASSSSTKPPTTSVRKSSTFRHIPLRARNPLPSSPLRPDVSAHSRTVSQPSKPTLEHPSPSRPYSSIGLSGPDPPTPSHGKERATESGRTTPTTSPRPIHNTLPLHLGHGHSKSADVSPRAHTPNGTLTPPPRASSLRSLPSGSNTPPAQTHAPAVIQPQASTSSASTSTPAVTPSSPRSAAGSPSSAHSTLIARKAAPYRPGFQPKGLYRPRTDEFVEARRAAHESGAARIERTKLERRLEKLVALHFPATDDHGGKEDRPSRPSPGSGRRASSFFDLDLKDLRNSIGNVDPTDLWRGIMMQGQAGRGGKNDVRAAEQRITPWEEDSTVSRCPLCSASFHPLTNRKHHCRLCGKIICSLPVKRPQRPLPCSILFVVDPKTRMIEEVGEGVDYGVRRRRTTSVDAGKSPPAAGSEPDEEKFLKGVRICRDCKPILLRQQYQQEVHQLPTFVRLYEVFIALEKEIEASLPQFQELLLGLNHDDNPTKDAMAARKRLLEAFAQYDTLSKRIRRLPCVAGSSQDRIQIAVMTRANLFLQKHMFPLQSLPKRAKPSLSPQPGPVSGPATIAIDPDSAVAHALQPLLEQEALLESFVEEANAHRKFEDAKTLKANLAEIRAEISRIVDNAGTNGGLQESGTSAKRRNGKAR